MKAKIIMLFAIAISAVNAVDCQAHPLEYECVCGITSFDQNNGMALSFISVAFMLVATSIALAYMYGKVRQDVKMETWAKDEASNLVITVLLFAGLLVFFTGSCAIAQEYGGNNPFTTSDNHLRYLLQTAGEGKLRALTQGSLRDQFFATNYYFWGISPFMGSGVAYNANFRAFSAHKEMIIDMYLPIAASINAQRYILQALQWLGASVLLPFAFVMRIIPPTRDFGNTLIAVFFGIYIVVPTMYAVSGIAFQKIMDNPLTCVDCGVENFYSYGIDNYGAGGKESMFYAIGAAMPQGIFLPNLVIIVTITCIMSMTKALRAFAV